MSAHNDIGCADISRRRANKVGKGIQRVADETENSNAKQPDEHLDSE